MGVGGMDVWQRRQRLPRRMAHFGRGCREQRAGDSLVCECTDQIVALLSFENAVEVFRDF